MSFQAGDISLVSLACKDLSVSRALGCFWHGLAATSRDDKLLKCLKSWYRLDIFTKQDLHAIVGNLNEEGAMEALEAENQ